MAATLGYEIPAHLYSLLKPTRTLIAKAIVGKNLTPGAEWDFTGDRKRYAYRLDWGSLDLKGEGRMLLSAYVYRAPPNPAPSKTPTQC